MSIRPRWTALLPLTFAAALAAPAAWALPILDAPPPVSGLGADVEVVYVSAEAADQSEVFLSGSSDTQLFRNNAGNYSPGYTVDLGASSSPMVFGLHNLTTGTTFLSNARSSDGYFHARFSTNLNDIVPGPLNSTISSQLASHSTAAPVLYIGFEDLLSGQGSDFDYNDLVVAVTNVDPPEELPEPMSLALVCTGLAGLFLTRRRSRR